MRKSIWAAVFILLISPGLTRGQNSCDLNRADMDCNGFLTIVDVARLQQKVYAGFGTYCDNPSTKGDLNCDGVRDGIDFQLLLKAFSSGQCYSCPPLPPTSPDPRDSIILETTVTCPSDGPMATTLRVWITNKDSLRLVGLPLREATLSGDAYAVLVNPEEGGFVNKLTPTPASTIVPLIGYNSASPDSFFIEADYDRRNPDRLEPPHSSRWALLDINFDTVSGSGQIVFDSLAVGSYFENTIQFADKNWRRVPVNFLPGVVTVRAIAKGDMNGGGELTPGDVVLMLNCVYLASGNCDLCFADVNCTGSLTPADLVVELQMVYLGAAAGC